MGKYCPAETVLDDEKLQRFLIIPSGVALNYDRPIARYKRIVNTHYGNSVLNWDFAMSTFSSMAFIAFVTPGPRGPVVNAVFFNHRPRWKIGRWHDLLWLHILNVNGICLNFLRLLNFTSNNHAIILPNLRLYLHRGAETTAPDTGVKDSRA